MKKTHFYTVLAAGLICLAFPRFIRAAPDAGVINGTTETFTGNQSQGVTAGSPPILTIDVHDLSGTIAPSSGVSGISLNNNSAGNVTINSGTNGSVVVISAANADGISTSSLGSPSSSPSTDPFLGVPILSSTSSVAGGLATVNSNSNITTTGAFADGISALSANTGYPDSVVQQLNSFVSGSNWTQFTFTVSSVGTSGTTVGTSVAATKLQVGTVVSGTEQDETYAPTGTSGGSLAINSSGAITAFNPGTDFNWDFPFRLLFTVVVG